MNSQDTQDGPKIVEVITLDSETEAEDADAAVECKFSEQTSSVLTTPTLSAFNSTSTSTPPSPIFQGLGGFINDFRTLTLDIQRLKNSQVVLKGMLETKQIELNKASEEWCTAQAQLAKNEMIIENQNAQMMSLEHQIRNVQIRNTTWDSKLNRVSCGLEAMFKSATNMTRQDDRIACSADGSPHNVTPDTAKEDATNVELQVQPYHQKSVALNFEKQDKSCKILSNPKPKVNSFLASKWRRSFCQRNSLNVSSTRLKFLREKFSKRMTEKQQFQRDIKNELTRKNNLLRSLTRFVQKNRLPRVVNRLNKEAKLEISIKNVKSLAPKSSTSSTSNSTQQHARDHSVPVQDGYACICGERYKFIATLHRHLGGGGNKKFTCDICNMDFLYFSNLSRHLRDKHKQFYPPNTHGCRTCGAVFSSKTELMNGWKHRNGKCIRRKTSPLQD